MDFKGIAQQIVDLITLYGLKIIAAIVIFIIGKWVAGIISKNLKKWVEGSKYGGTLSSFVGNLAYYGLLVFVIIASLNQLGVQTASFVAVLGAAGLAIGLALQGSLSNFASGVLIIIFRPFQVGDKIEAAGVIGDVESIEIFVTKLKTADSKLAIIPNSKITSNEIINYTAKGVIRIDMFFGIGYDDDILRAEKILKGILDTHEKVLKDPAYTVAVHELGNSSVNFAVWPHVKPENYWEVYFDIHKQVKLRFDDEGISIPYPQTDVHLFNEK